MTSALINGFIGLGLSLWIGTQALDFSAKDIIYFVVISNFASVISLILTLAAEKNPWLKKTFLNHTLKTWAMLATLYYSILLFFCPLLRSTHALLYLSLPLILSTGFGILAFGPIQDQIVRKGQKKTPEISTV
jgi:hypothetical protein